MDRETDKDDCYGPCQVIWRLKKVKSQKSEDQDTGKLKIRS